jgi:hypothetical protein
MSRFTKLIFTLLGSATALYLLTCTSFSFNEKKTINEDELISFVSTELEYELIHGDNTVEIDSFIDKAIKEKLQSN